MQPLPEFSGLDRSFWAHAKLVSERLGYSRRTRGGTGFKELRSYTIEEVEGCLKEASLRTDHVKDPATGRPTPLGELLCRYLNRRAEVLKNLVAPNLMNREEAARLFLELRTKLSPKCALPMNKQKGEKAHYAYLTCIINMLTERALGRRTFEDSPRGLAIITKEGVPLRTFSRWMDGAYPSRIDPYALWEIKEYYGTTTFGSRVADGVYETMLDGEEFKEAETQEGRKVLHYLIVDDRYTWWEMGRSYLCRIVDMLHVGLVDEVLFGREVVKRWPQIVKSWP